MARNAYSFEKFQRDKRKAEKRRQRLEKRQARQSKSDDGDDGVSVGPEERTGDAGADDRQEQNGQEQKQ